MKPVKRAPKAYLEPSPVPAFQPDKFWGKMEIFDIACNITHPQFRGKYKNYNAHANDIHTVLKRGEAYGVKKYLFSACYLEDARLA